MYLVQGICIMTPKKKVGKWKVCPNKYFRDGMRAMRNFHKALDQPISFWKMWFVQKNPFIPNKNHEQNAEGCLESASYGCA